MSHKKYRSDPTCLNCGATIRGKFCSECGQENIETRENFFHLSYEFVADYFHFDSKFLRSTLPLVTKPGFLTQEYWEGKRMRYIHPLRLFFFVTIVFMLAATFFYNHLGNKKIADSLIVPKTAPTRQNSPTADPPGKTDGLKVPKQAVSRVRADLQVAIDHFFHDLKYISFFLLPIYAMIFRLLYIRRKGFYVDHLVYTLHLQSFIYLLVAVAFVSATFWVEHISVVRRLTLIVVLIYVTISLRFLYRQPWWKTVMKSLLSTGLLAIAMVLVMGIYLLAYSTFT